MRMRLALVSLMKCIIYPHKTRDCSRLSLAPGPGRPAVRSGGISLSIHCIHILFIPFYIILCVLLSIVYYIACRIIYVIIWIHFAILLPIIWSSVRQVRGWANVSRRGLRPGTLGSLWLVAIVYDRPKLGNSGRRPERNFGAQMWLGPGRHGGIWG